MNDIQMAGPWVSSEDIEIVVDALKNGWYGKDAYRYVELFEKEFAKYCQAKYAIALSSCGAALKLSSIFQLDKESP